MLLKFARPQNGTTRRLVTAAVARARVPIVDTFDTLFEQFH
jgi:hypothetical protein